MVNFMLYVYVMLYIFCHILKISETNTDDPMCPEGESDIREWHYMFYVLRKSLLMAVCSMVKRDQGILLEYAF